MRAVLRAGLMVAMASLSGCGGSSTAPGSSPAGPAPATGGPPRSVVLVTIDTLRADRLTPDIAPALSAFAATGVRFTTARTTVPLTLPAHTTLLTGQRPPQHGVHLNGQTLADDVPTLATALKNAGYETAAFVGAYALDRRFGLARGFSTYDDQVTRDWDAADRLEAERPAGAVVDAAIAWLDRVKDGPVFLWVHMYDPHAPYAPPEPYRTRFASQLYDGEVAYADAEAGRLLARLQARSGAADTIVVVAGDHGEGLGAHGEATHGVLAYDSTLRVPLIVRAPGLAPGVQAAPVSLADVAGAVLRLSRAGASLPAASTRDILDGDTTAEVYAETEYPAVAGWHPLRVLAGASRKLIRSSTIEFYDVAGDAAETTDLAGRDTAAARQAVARLTALQGDSRTAAGPTPEAQARLRSLGYASGPSAQAIAQNAPNPARAIDAWTRFERVSAEPPSRASLAALEALTRDHPEGYVFVTGYARALAALGRHAEAVRVLKAAVVRFPQDAPLFHDLAVAAREAGDTTEALTAEQAALALDDTYAAAHHGLALLHADAGRLGDALGPFARAVELDPTNAAYWADLGNAYRDDGDVQQADTAYGRALQLDPRHADAANGRGVLLVQAGHPADAIGWFTRALSRDPDFHAARLNLGIAYQQSGQRERAVETFRQVLARAPKSARERQAATELLRALK